MKQFATLLFVLMGILIIGAGMIGYAAASNVMQEISAQLTVLTGVVWLVGARV